MPDPYLYEDVPVLRNKLDIRDGKTLDLVEAEQSRQNMMLLYEKGFDDFTPAGLCRIHRILLDAVCDEPADYDAASLEESEPEQQSEKYKKYQREEYKPPPHYRRED